MKALRTTTLFIVSIVAMLLCALVALALREPAAPLSFVQGESSTFNASLFAAQHTEAVAGNITFLTIEGISQTRSWQGYYGNVTGWITLDDASNFTFYNWSAAEPRGNIYATLINQVNWLSVGCFDHSTQSVTFDTGFNIAQDDYDNVTNTFNTTMPTTIYIVNNSFNTCPATYIWRDDDYQTNDFINYLMYDSSSLDPRPWVFGTIIENKDVSNRVDKSCYNGAICDFQILVAEDGHGTDTATTTYYFWVDLTG